MAEKYEASSYRIFDDAISTTKKMIGDLDTTNDSINKTGNSLNNKSVFEGPAADEAQNGFKGVQKRIEKLKGNYDTIATLLNETAENYKSGDENSKSKVLSMDDNGVMKITESSAFSGSTVTNGNIIDTSSPVAEGTKYNLSDDDLAHLAYVALREQGSVEGAKLELSLMANLYEKNSSRYSSVRDYVDNSGWFAAGSRTGYSYPGDAYVQVAHEVLNEGNRYLPSNVVEHDCISDLTSCSTGSVSDTSSYIPGQTVLTNRYGARYMFVGFAPNGGDPFGYLV